MLACLLCTPLWLSHTAAAADSGHSVDERQAAFWFKPARASYAADLAMIRSKSHLISTLFVYCEYTVLPDGSFGVASNQSWFHSNWGDHQMCTPQYFSELAGDDRSIKVQLMLSMGDAMVTSYRRAFDNPKQLLAGMLHAIQNFDAEIVVGWNVDWEPCHPQSTAPGTVPADGVTFSKLLAQMKSAHAPANRTISVDVSQWCNMTSNFAALAAAVDSVQDMGTYHADSAENFQSKLALTTAVPREKLWVGLGFGEQMTKYPYETAPAGLSERFEALVSAGVRNVAMFELPSADKLEKWNMTQAWWHELDNWVGRTRFSDEARSQATATTDARPVCTLATDISLSTSWGGGQPGVSDLFYVAIASGPNKKPFALQTSATPTTTIHDLLPSTDYYLSWRSHPQSQTVAGRNIGWDWSSYSPSVKCTTKAADNRVPSNLRRTGVLARTSINVSWTAPVGATGSVVQHLAGHRTDAANPFTWVAASTTTESSILRASLLDLQPGSTHETVAGVRLANGDVKRGPVVPMRTAAALPATRYTKLVRVSEFTDDVDFLDNHDSATSAALAVLLSRMAKQVNVSVQCLQRLDSLCPEQRGLGLSCLACVKNASSLPAACGNEEMSDYNTHFFCGEGWPSFSMYSTPMAEYCVENIPAPLPKSPTQDAGWAEYLSCDAPEAGESNHPVTPQCICWVPCSPGRVCH